VRPVWREVWRVLRPGGILLAGFTNPVLYIFDEKLADEGELKVRHSLPYSDLASLPEEERNRRMAAGDPLIWSHSLEDLIGGQLEAGLVLTNLYEDTWPGQIISKHMPSFIARGR